MTATKKAIVLLSGGLDSSTVLAIAQSQGFEVYALSFSYGQRHSAELHSADRVAARTAVARHLVTPIDLRLFGGSALTDDIDVPKARSHAEMTVGVPVTYVPARNTIFLSFALAYAEVVGAEDIFLGVNALDYSGYPDCRPEFIHAFQTLAGLATKAGVDGHPVRIRAPLIDMTKAEIIQTGTGLGVDYSITLSCYDPSPIGEACGACDACQLRLKGFHDAGLEDPAPYIRPAREVNP